MNMALDTPATRARRWYEAGAISAMPSDGHRSRPAPRSALYGMPPLARQRLDARDARRPAGPMRSNRTLRGLRSSSGSTRPAPAAIRGGRSAARAAFNIEESVTINRPVHELYRFWRNFENLPQFMGHLESVERLTETMSRWRARGPAGYTAEWNAEIINEIPDKLIAWRSIEGSDVVSAGSVHFDDAGPGRGTRIRVRLQYSPPGGKVGGDHCPADGRGSGT